MKKIKSKIPPGTPFQQKVWEELLKIPSGETRSYQEIAQAIGRPFAYRAVGQACKKNPWPVVIPCHRVICAKGALGGFSQGQDKKKRLLDKEKSGQ